MLLDEHYDEHYFDLDYDSHDLHVDEHNHYDDNDLFRPTEWVLLHRRHSVL